MSEPTTARAIRVHETGGADALSWDEVTVAPPAEGEALVRHTAIGLNFIDVYHRTGLYELPSLPHGIGVEAAGVVEAVGEGVEDLAVGQRVAYAAGPPGSYATARCIDAAKLVPLPDDISDEDAAAGLLQGMTVEYLIRRTFAVAPGQKVLWHAAAGGVGLIACQWLSHLGVDVIDTVSTEAKARLATENGCRWPVIYTEEDFVERVRELTGGDGVPVVYDSVGKDTFERSLDCLQRRGTMVAFGNASGRPEPLNTLELAQKGSLYLTRPTLFDYVATREELLGSAEALFDVVRAGAVDISPRQRWSLEQAPAAHRALESRETQGATVLIP